MLERHIEGIASGSSASMNWPTAAVNDMGENKTPEEWDEWTEKMRGRHGNGNGHGNSLSVEARRIGPPPPASGPPDPVKLSTSGSRREWYTPDVPNGGRSMPADSTGTGMTPKGKRQVGLHNQMKTQASGKLSPAWVETLMGVPMGHTQLPHKFVKPKKGTP